jgi:hypothetical protein
MLIDITMVKEFLGIIPPTDDNVLLPLVKSAQVLAESYCDRVLEGSTFIEFHDGDGVDIIQLRIFPVVSIASIYDDFDRVYPVDSLISPTNYTFFPATGLVTLIGLVFHKYTNNIKVTYDAGYNGIGQTAYTNMPLDLKQALIFLTVAQYLEAKAGVNVFANQDIVYRPSYLRKEAYKILDGYRRLSL